MTPRVDTGASAHGRTGPAAFVAALAVLAVAIALSAWYFLRQAPQEVPMGDAYIHFVYARNLAQNGEVAFNPGQAEGIGTSSPLWVAALALMELAGMPPVVAAKTLGLVSLLVVGLAVFDLARNLAPPRLSDRQRTGAALLAALLATLPGNTLWQALSGMETMFFFALGLVSVNLYVRRRWYLLGFFLGLLTLTRAEGILLLGALFLTEFIRYRRLSTPLVKSAIVVLALVIPWEAYILLREGVPLPNSLRGKLIVTEEATNALAAQFPALGWLMRFSPGVYIAAWIGYVALYMTGAAFMPGPAFNFQGPLAENQFSLSIIGISASLAVIAWLGGRAVRRAWAHRSDWREQTARYAPLIALLLWTLLHNASYAIILPQPGAAGRYAPMNHLLLWECLLCGALTLNTQRARAVGLLALAGLVAASVAGWQAVYKANIDYMVDVRLPAARFIDQNMPPAEAIGAVDLGPLRYYARQPTVDLIGYVNQEVADYRGEDGDLPDYINAEDICYLLMFDSTQANDEQWEAFSAAMGLEVDSRFALVPVRTWSVPLKTWALGNAAVSNYMPAMSVVAVDWKDKSSGCEPFQQVEARLTDGPRPAGLASPNPASERARPAVAK